MAKTMRRLDHARILMYSHDTFGLGHLRRCRTIAHALVEHYRGLNVLIVSGSTIAGAFDYRVRVDFVKVPSVIKLHNGEYTSMSRHMDLHETMQMRQSIIRHTAESFRPDIFIADKEPLGLRGELEETLSFLKRQGTTLVLGLREVMDAPYLLADEWAKRDVLSKVNALYDMVWVYGPRDFYDPLFGFDVPASLEARMHYVGFIQKRVPRSFIPPNRPEGDYLLVTTGGGGDGSELIHNIFGAYRSDSELRQRLYVVLGPFMPANERRKLLKKGKKIPQVQIVEFDNRLEDIMNGAKAVIGMCGYNTFTEILSFDKPALMVPRIHPREEQLIRARRAAELGVIDMLLPHEAAEPARLAKALKALPHRAPPSRSGVSLPLNGLDNIVDLVGEWMEQRTHKHLSLVEGGA